MKKIFSVFALSVLLTGCYKADIIEPIRPQASDDLKIATAVGIKLQSPFVTSEVAMNVKSDIAQTVTIKIFDIANRVVSKSTSEVEIGDNILKVYTTTLPTSAYRIALYDLAGKQLGITDFNKL
jgi:uncharacterized protein (UPF0333 family)